jgi:predicted nucleic acid-binding protein
MRKNKDGGDEIMRIYLDNCSFNRPYDDQTQIKILFETEAKLFIQQQILSKNYELAWSYVLDYEIGKSPFSERKDQIMQWKNIARLHCVENESILLEAEKLQKIGLKVVDSLHVACADFMQCDYILTTDRKMLNKPIKQVTQIPVVNPIEFFQREVNKND